MALPGAAGKVDVAGSDGVDANLLGAELAGQVLRVVAQCGLGCGVRQRRRRGLEGDDRGDVEDRSAVWVGEEIGQDGLGEARGGEEVEFEEALPLFRSEERR